MKKPNSRIIKYLSSQWIYVALALLFISHLFFISSDPDVNLSPGSRGPWMDEGLYTAQIRNYVNHHQLTIEQSPCLIYTPFLSAILYLPYKFFGTTMEVGRITLIVFTISGLILISFFDKYFKGVLGVIILLTLTQYHIFHYSHIALAELLSTISILIGIFFFYCSQIRRKKAGINNFISAVFFSLAYLFKIQYIYIITLVPTYLAVKIFVEWLKYRKIKAILRFATMHCLALAGLFVLCFAIWYYPNSSFYNSILNTVGNRAGGNTQLGDTLRIVFLPKEIIFCTGAFFVAIVCGGVMYTHAETSRKFKVLFPLLLVWLVLESHKLSVGYLPIRYLVSLYFSLGVITSLVINEGLRIFKVLNLPFRRGIMILIILGIVTVSNNVLLIGESINRRTYALKETSDYLNQFSFLSERAVMGAWAPALTWKCKAFAYPIWAESWNENLIEKLNPSMIITEVDEIDSDSAFSKNGVFLEYLSDSVSHASIMNWDLKMYWMGNNKRIDVETLLDGYDLIGSEKNFSIYLNHKAHRLVLQKKNWEPKDFAYNMFLRYTLENYKGEAVYKDEGFEWGQKRQLELDGSAFIIKDLPYHKIEKLSIGQYYFDGDYKYPWVINYKSPIDKLYPSREELLENFELIGSMNDFSIFLNRNSKRLVYEKKNWKSSDYNHSFFVRYNIEEGGNIKSGDSGFEWLVADQIIFGNDAYLIKVIPSGNIKNLSTGQFYFDGGYKYPWVIEY